MSSADKVQAIREALVNAYPQQLELAVVVEDERVLFDGEVFSPEGRYPIHGFVTLDELIRLDEAQCGALVLMRSMIGAV